MRVKTTYKKLCGFVFVIMLVAAVGADRANAEPGQTPEQVLLEYHATLKQGDVDKMMSLLADKFYARYKDMLEKDPGYSDFIKDYYEGSTITIQESDIQFDDAVVQVLILFPNGNTSTNKFHLKRFNDDIWRITDQYLE